MSSSNDDKFAIKVLMRIDDETKIAITPDDHSPGIYLSGSQFREIVLNPDTKDKQMNLDVIDKKLREYEKNGLAKGQEANEWLVIDKKFIVKSNSDKMPKVDKNNLIGKVKKIILL